MTSSYLLVASWAPLRPRYAAATSLEAEWIPWAWQTKPSKRKHGSLDWMWDRVEFRGVHGFEENDGKQFGSMLRLWDTWASGYRGGLKGRARSQMSAGFRDPLLPRQ